MVQGTISVSRVVSWDLQEGFAALTGDRNPIHMDPMAARRTQAGLPVVHGVHTLLWALDSLARTEVLKTVPIRIKAKFLKWVYIGDEARLDLPSSDKSDCLTFCVQVGGMSVLTVELTFGVPRPITSHFETRPAPESPRPMAVDQPLSSLAECSGDAFVPTAAGVRSLFPSLAILLSEPVVAEIAACSYVVGMEVPGLLSMFSRLDLAVLARTTAFMGRSALRYRVLSVDERFRKVRIALSGRSVDGVAEAFSRVPPVAQRPILELAAYVIPSEFRGMTALVVGGSRGLGELTAKLISAGGGSAIITYSVGESDAERVCADIRLWGGSAEIMHYDIRRPPSEQLSRLTSRPSHVFYFATNAIFRPKEHLVSASILADFSAFYLVGFHDLCLQLLRQFPVDDSGHPALVVYYPSSVAVEERPNGMTEYSMVKAAGEQMCRDLNQFTPGLRILTTRLPRLRTDQTATIVPEREQEPVTVILPIIRQMKSLMEH